MSAYICDNNTINAIVKAFGIYETQFFKYEAENYTAPKGWLIDLQEERNAIGQSLLEQNHKSVNYRYNENTATPKYAYKDVAVDEGIILGCIENYEYQACETPGYYETKLHKSLLRLKLTMLDRLIRKNGMKIPYGYDGNEIEILE